MKLRQGTKPVTYGHFVQNFWNKMPFTEAARFKMKPEWKRGRPQWRRGGSKWNSGGSVDVVPASNHSDEEQETDSR
jgi:hypothetical protein